MSELPGLVGGDLVNLLLLQGHSPDSIRILDLRAPHRHDMTREPACNVDFVRTDITSKESVANGFGKEWPAATSCLPITVHHIAAEIRPSERDPIFYPRVAAVNVGGTRNVLEAAKAAGVDIFVATSSGAVGFRPFEIWSGGLPWVRHPKGYYQIFTEKDFVQPMRPHSQFFSNYAASKAVAERIVCGANSNEFRTGCIRPATIVYGEVNDQLVGYSLKKEKVPTWTRHYVQSFVASKNVGLAHLLLEAALVQKKMPKCAGRPFNISDSNPPSYLGDVYMCAKELAVTPFEVYYLTPVVLFLLAYVIEAWCIAVAKWPILTRLRMKEPSGDIRKLQPAVFFCSNHLIGLDSEARKPVAEGGIGYQGGCRTLEGICEEILQWNQRHSSDADAVSTSREKA